MGRWRKELESVTDLMEEQYFQSQETKESYHRLALTIREQLVTRECLELLDDLGEHIQASMCYSHYIYRHPEEWGDYAKEQERAALERLLRGEIR